MLDNEISGGEGTGYEASGRSWYAPRLSLSLSRLSYHTL